MRGSLSSGQQLWQPESQQTQGASLKSRTTIQLRQSLLDLSTLECFAQAGIDHNKDSRG